MKSHEIFGQIIRTFGVHAVADSFNVGKDLSYKYGQKHGEGLSGAINPLDKLKSMVDYLNESGRSDVTANIRSFLFPDNEKAVHSETLAARFGVNANRCFIEIQDALRDGEVDDAERARILKGIHKIEELCIEVRALCRREKE